MAHATQRPFHGYVDVPPSGQHTEDGERILILTSYMRVQKDEELR